MMHHTSWTRLWLLPINALAVAAALTGCNVDQGIGHPIREKLCVQHSPAACIPGPGYQTTVWQTWHEGPMAIRSCDCAWGPVRIQPLPEEGSIPVPPIAPRPPSEVIPVPEAQRHGAEPNAPTQGKQPLPASKDSAPAQEKPPEKPADKPPLASGTSLDHETPIITIPLTFPTDSIERLGEVWSDAGSMILAEHAEAFSSGIFSDRPVPPTSSSQEEPAR